MSQHLYGAEQHGSGVGSILEGQVESHVPRSLLKHHVLSSNVPPRTDPGSTHQPRPNVPHYVAVEIRHHHHIKLVWPRYQLYSQREREGGKVISLICGVWRTPLIIVQYCSINVAVFTVV